MPPLSAGKSSKRHGPELSWAKVKRELPANNLARYGVEGLVTGATVMDPGEFGEEWGFNGNR